MAEERKKPNAERTVYIQPTTGGRIEMKVAPGCTVACLKRAVSKRIRVPKDRIVLLHKNKQLVEGTLESNNVPDNASLTLLPSVETGLMNQRPELCVMQALETLNDNQVDSFLTGKSPLNLTMRLGDHMMFIQLQLSTITPACATSTSRTPSATTSSLPTPPTTPTSPSTPLQFPVPVPPVSSAPPSPPPSPKLTAPPQPTPAAEAPNNGAPSSLNSSALAEASRNLTHTLRQLSSAALGKKMNHSCDGRCCNSRRQGGAVIESMFHHGRGVYSGTFSGTLSPSLQDKDGRPRRDISTIIHILNDLLGASSHCHPSAQCLCSRATCSTTATTATVTTTTATPSTSPSHTVGTLEVKVDGQSKQDENKMLRQKVEHIQSMLEERRQRRKARRDLRASPYPTAVVQDSKSTASSGSSHETEMTNFTSSETAVA